MITVEKTDLKIGYIPLLDCIALLWANHKGYFTAQGLNVNLVKEPSWASLRDRLAYNVLDAAHCLSAMLPTAAIGEDHLGIPLQTPLILSSNRAFISLSQKLSHQYSITANDSPTQSAIKLVKAIEDGHHLQIAHVFNHSIHHYVLREWLSLANLDLATHYQFVTLPPPNMVEAISLHLIDGFCVGEPWNMQAEIQGYSHVITASEEIIPPVPDKVLAVTQDWAEQHPNTLKAITLAIQHAQQDLSAMHDFSEVWQLLQLYQIVRFNCSEEIHVSTYYKIKNIIQSLGHSATPQASEFEWIIKAMNRWDHLNLSPDEIQNLAKQCIYSE